MAVLEVEGSSADSMDTLFPGEVSKDDLIGMLPPRDELAFVDEIRRVNVARIINILLVEDLQPNERKIHVAALRHMGALSVLDHMPQKEYTYT